MSTLNLGLIGNSRTSALIDQKASIVWWCFPVFDSDPICCALLQKQDPENASGLIDIQLGDAVLVKQEYERNSAILSSLFADPAGNSFEVIDFAPRFRMHGRLFSPSMLVRIIRVVSGRPRIALRIRPTINYGHERAEVRSGTHHISYLGGEAPMRLTTDASISAILTERPFFLQDSLTLMMGPDETVNGSPHDVGRSFYEQTLDYWQNWVRNLAIPFEWQDVVIRAAITLKLNAFDDTGAIIAAVTTSIPEAANSGRNWDYRYCWLRDAYFVINALNRLGATATMERYLGYILNIIADTRDTPMQPVYGIRREATLTENTAPALAGYRGMGPVRVGNLAYNQIQNDVFGAAIMASTHAFFDMRLARPADRKIFDDLERLGDQAILSYNTPDAGIWELRGSKRVHTFSSIMCWAACDRLASIAGQLKLADRAHYWSSNASKMHHHICEAAWNPAMQSFVSTFGGEHLDASLLLMAEFQFLPATDPRFISTVNKIGTVLRRGDFLLRYDEEDDFGKPETAFLVCTLWWILALAQIGEKVQARELFEKVLTHRNPLGLLAEDVAPETGELWGNFPQTYSMVGLIQCASRLSMPWDEAY
ncbi:glycoside hydrolase family 15 protein [Undibacterium sp. RTI2.1]|uniref:glycoside hydrolase family 15 protein n=1 Tax=unclassified Undibacterium TaxID=2630295 RepID=UPI002AB48D95|nr:MULTISPECIES: glycoside hydrolase family 15 protein [unclassified Undibacterium]MDY7538542.1 glycoside hydrolase family 15 protein [Undibacterium sp. 5I1]MEB0031914.1 glycoside hydrolase family 15 protein [Undibacterium sp. RTI2.1]MEB0116378.1 glycoside hydrolase family 15 protein [Undibacterium sp. RTI2.2]MEB0231859.1 glycoside hydrolase family 15 protein [Undibacterium sp. 10I3]MEB0258963.1 glycoside hydrolase family 15 protein [Undibacterium sp. 5I1]